MNTLSSITQALAQLVRGGDVSLPTLDVDELAALLPPDAPCMPPVPTLGDSAAALRGRASLDARGLVAGDAVRDSDIDLLLVLRRFPTAIVIVESHVADATAIRCYLGFPDSGFLEETVCDPAPRSFALRSTESTLRSLESFCNPTGVGGVGGALRQEPTGESAVVTDADRLTRINATKFTAAGEIAQVDFTVVVAGGRLSAVGRGPCGETMVLPLSRRDLREVLQRLVSNTFATR